MRRLPERLGESWRRILHCNELNGITVRAINISKRGIANASAFFNMAWKTVSNAPGDALMMRSTSDVAVCCSNASVRSVVRCRNSLSNRAFSMAMTA